MGVRRGKRGVIHGARQRVLPSIPDACGVLVRGLPVRCCFVFVHERLVCRFAWKQHIVYLLVSLVCCAVLDSRWVSKNGCVLSVRKNNREARQQLLNENNEAFPFLPVMMESGMNRTQRASNASACGVDDAQTGDPDIPRCPDVDASCLRVNHCTVRNRPRFVWAMTMHAGSLKDEMYGQPDLTPVSIVKMRNHLPNSSR